QLASVRRLQEAIVLIAEESDDERARLDARLHVAALTVDQALQPSPHRLEPAVDDGREVGVQLVVERVLRDHELVPRRHRDVNADAIWVARALVALRALDRDATTRDVIAESLQPCCV